MKMQKRLRLSVQGRSGLVLTLSEPVRHVEPSKLLADLLKRQARQVCSDITECPPDTLPAHLARLDGLREVFAHVIRHEYAATADGRLSGAQLQYPSTLADWLAVMVLTRRDHRAPAFVNSRDADLAKILRGIDQLAGLIANRPDLVEFLAKTEQGEVV